MRNALREWLGGHVTINIRGKRFERFINRAVKEGLHIWNIKRLGEESGQFDMLVEDYKRIRPLLRETGCRTHVHARKGGPFWLRMVYRRLGFAIGALLFLIGVYMLSTFVWSVEVKGTKKLPVYKVLQVAEQYGIKRGAWQPALGEPTTLQRKLLGLLPEASWIGVEKTGTKIIIQVVEKEQPEKPPVEGPRNIIAKKKAVVHTILAEKGKTMVQKDQFVQKGQVLISGIIGNEMRQAVVAARGKVEGEVWYQTKVTVPLNQTRYMFTGHNQNNVYLTLGSQSIRIWPLQGDEYASFETKNEQTLLSLGRFLLPIGITSSDQMETEPQIRMLSKEQAIELAKQVARQDVLRQAEKDAKIADEKVLQIKEENGKVYLSMHYTVIEDITAEQPFTNVQPAP
ncbi:sporulation protein YqfD [Brevibacillus fluminis]|uniref:Sporulation protein YqfD n=1 Tax=Brevibacillus fluminis TaxID=511487 RepID=A0A3M8D4Y8_9BACL|nr:sporulation protein YqfD [Brevibacillus fluminis]RNB82285.1 sporulation protein YqfD [Brevibacillus fluminis]